MVWRAWLENKCAETSKGLQGRDPKESVPFAVANGVIGLSRREDLPDSNGTLTVTNP